MYEALTPAVEGDYNLPIHENTKTHSAVQVTTLSEPTTFGGMQNSWRYEAASQQSLMTTLLFLYLGHQLPTYCHVRAYTHTALFLTNHPLLAIYLTASCTSPQHCA